MSGWTTAM